MSEQVLSVLTCPTCKIPLKHLKGSNLWVCPKCGAVAATSVFVELTPEEAYDRYMPVISEKVCGKCWLKGLCDSEPREGCEAIKIIEMLFLSGKISLQEACEAAALPNKHVKITYRLR